MYKDHPGHDLPHPMVYLSQPIGQRVDDVGGQFSRGQNHLGRSARRTRPSRCTSVCRSSERKRWLSGVRTERKTFRRSGYTPKSLPANGTAQAIYDGYSAQFIQMNLGNGKIGSFGKTELSEIIDSNFNFVSRSLRPLPHQLSFPSGTDVLADASKGRVLRSQSLPLADDASLKKLCVLNWFDRDIKISNFFHCFFLKR